MVCSMSMWIAGLALVMPQLLKGPRGGRGSTDSLTDHGLELSSETDESFLIGVSGIHRDPHRPPGSPTPPHGSKLTAPRAYLHVHTSGIHFSQFLGLWVQVPTVLGLSYIHTPAPKTHYPALRILMVSELLQFLTKNYQLNLDRSFFST